uniref:Reverse transcriptase Ty1/copia-type domain-containing protein n=1 Tax=Tanacetum cinerariifolium TaxID=118510 RepID=A0A6L2JIT7_TANCI|nr:hypothetical protein [Tanacetum cinerariifolium]
MLKRKVNTTPVDYAVLNQLSQDFETRFVPQTELSVEQVFWSQNSVNSSNPTPSNRPTKAEVPKELPKVRMVNTSLKKLKHHLAGFDVVVKERSTATALTEGTRESLQNDLRKLKGKALVDKVVTSHNIDPEMLKIDVETLAPKLLNNRTVHFDYLWHTQEQAAILREVVEQGKSQDLLNNSLDHVSPVVIALSAKVVAPEPAASTDTPSSTTVDQDAPSPSAVDPTLFTRKARNDLLLVQIYVYDKIFASTNTAMCNEFSNSMTTKFKMSIMGQMSCFLGLQISQSPRGIFINQSKYASEIVKKYGMLSSDSIDTPLVEKSKMDEDLQGKPVDATLYHGMIGSLMYLTSSRPDLTYAVCLCVRWSSKKQKCTAISSTEAEYITLSGCCAQILWMRSQLTDYGFEFNKIPLYCDNKSAIALSCNSLQHSRAKHIDVRYHFRKKQVENEIVKLYFVRSEYQLADNFTKPLPRERFIFLIEKLGMKSMSPDTLKCLAEETNE